MSNRDPRHTPHTHEPDYLPNQAEGAGSSGTSHEPHEPTEHLRTPGQAEGERADVEETLTARLDSEEGRTQHLRENLHDATTDKRSFWQRVKELFGMETNE